MPFSVRSSGSQYFFNDSLSSDGLSDRSGVKVRKIQAYGQDCQDKSKAEALNVNKPARVLKCLPELIASNR